MKVKDIITCALRLIGREDVAAAVADGAAEGERGEVAQTMLYCFNAVEDELARCYFPLAIREEKTVKSGRIAFADLSQSPVKILSVTRDGKPLDFSLGPQYIAVNAQSCTVEYRYSPAKKGMEDDSSYDGTAVGENLIASGAAAEFCLINGESLAAETWESRYRAAIDRARQIHRRKYFLPPRRWV